MRSARHIYARYIEYMRAEQARLLLRKRAMIFWRGASKVARRAVQLCFSQHWEIEQALCLYQDMRGAIGAHAQAQLYAIECARNLRDDPARAREGER